MHNTAWERDGWPLRPVAAVIRRKAAAANNPTGSPAVETGWQEVAGMHRRSKPSWGFPHGRVIVENPANSVAYPLLTEIPRRPHEDAGSRGGA